MLKRGKSKRAIGLAAAALAIVGGATIGLGGTANAATGNPPPSTTDWFSLYLTNNGYNRYFTVCNEQSAANTVYVAVEDRDLAGARVLLRDVNSGWTTYGANINFNPGGCEEFYIDPFSSSPGHKLQGYIKTPTFYGTGEVKWN